MTIHTDPETKEVTFRIGTASRMTGIPVDTLRVWERRYAVVTPLRSPGADRLYNKDHINRLSLLKKLVDRGHAIGTIANLSNEMLAEQLQAYDNQIRSNKGLMEDSRPVRIAVFGDVLVHRIKEETLEPDIELIGLHKRQLEFETTIAEKSVDAIILEYSAIHNDTVRDIKRLARQSNARHVFIIYGFSSSKVLETFDSNDYTLLQAPVSLSRLTREIKKIFTRQNQQYVINFHNESITPAPARIFTNKSLVEAYNKSHLVKCECPQHLSNIIQKLVEFEIYSSDCENRNEDDARLHAYLKAATGHARAMMENSLKHVLEAEGLEIENIK